MVMEYPLQDFDCDQETSFLLEQSPCNEREMDVHTARNNRNTKRRRSVGSILCRSMFHVRTTNEQAFVCNWIMKKLSISNEQLLKMLQLNKIK